MPNRVAVLGAGTMGAGIAQLAATHQWDVSLYDVSSDAVRRAMANIHRRLDRSVAVGEMTASQRDIIGRQVTPCYSMDELGDVDVAIETVTESLEVKREVFRALEQATRPGTLLVTNTSSLSVAEIAASVQDQSRVLGMHFFNPPTVMVLVEVVPTEATERAEVDRAITVARAWGRVPVRAKDTPGFIVNRVARPFTLEALRMLGDQIGGVELIDRVARELGGFRMGPFELIDFCGADVNYEVSRNIWERLGRVERLAPHEFQTQLAMNKGRLGKKSGKGFYDYGTTPPVPCPDVQPNPLAPLPATPGLKQSLSRFAKALRVNGDLRETYILARILCGIIYEAALALTEGVATRQDVDTAMRLATNYPRGPFEWRSQLGEDVLHELQRHLGGPTDTEAALPAHNV